MSTPSILKDRTKESLALMARMIIFFNYSGSVLYKWVAGTTLDSGELADFRALVKDAIYISLESGESMPTDLDIEDYSDSLLVKDLDV